MKTARERIIYNKLAEEPGETWDECERKVQHLLNEELDVSDVVIERADKVKLYSSEKKNSKKIRPRTVVCRLLSFVGKARITKNSYHLKGTSYYITKILTKKH